MKENNNGNDICVGSIENNIQEDINILNDFIEGNFQKDKLENYKGSYKMGYFYYKDIRQTIEHILSDYKRLQEEFKAVDSECSRLEHKEVELEKIIELMSEHIFFNQSDKFPIAYSIKDVKDYFINKAKEVKQMNEEEKEAVEDIKRELSDEDRKEYMSSWFAKDLDIAVNLIEKLQKENEKYKRLSEMNLKNAEEFKNNMCEHRCLLKSENKELKEYIAIAPNLDEMTATKYRNIRQDAYIQGRAEEQQKAEQIIYENYISVQKIKDKIEDLKKEENYRTIDNPSGRVHFRAEGCDYKIQVLKELLEESEKN